MHSIYRYFKPETMAPISRHFQIPTLDYHIDLCTNELHLQKFMHMYNL